MKTRIHTIAPAKKRFKAAKNWGIIICAILIGVIGVFSLSKSLVFATDSPWTQTDWSGGSAGGTVTGTVNTYSTLSSIDTSVSGSMTLSTTSGWCNNAYCNSAWRYRKKITFDNTNTNLGVTSETLTDFPVLIKLSSSNIDYSATKDAGEDIRFTDSDGTTNLSYEIEKWDESDTSYVWVKVPQINSNSNSDYIYIYYGNSAAVDNQSAANVWDSSYQGVWHLGETSGTNINDSAGSLDGAKSSSANPASISGKIGGAQDFSGDEISVSDSNDLDLTSSMTLSMWVTADSLATWNSIIMKSTDGNWANGYGIYYNNALCGFITNYNSYKACATFSTTATHRYIVATYNGSALKLYIDGTEAASYNTSVAISTNSATLGIGRGSGGAYNWDGIIDEVRISSVGRSAAYVAASYKSESDDFTTFNTLEEAYVTSGNLVSNILDSNSGGSFWGILSYSSSGSGTVVVKARTSNNSDMSGATSFSSCDALISGNDISTNNCVTDGHRYFQYQVSLSSSSGQTPTFNDISLVFTSFDNTAPITNASSISMSTAISGGRVVTDTEYNSGATPYFNWNAGADNDGGSGIKGYCIYLGTTSSSNPGTTSGLLTNSPISTSGTTCGFINSGTTLNLASADYLSSDLVDGQTYYINIKVIDNGNNIFGGSSATFSFLHDQTSPINVAYISMPSGSFSNVTDMSFSWPTSGANTATDATSGVLGYQYQINGTSGEWHGTSSNDDCDLDYIPTGTGSYTLTSEQDGSSIVVGNNVIYFRTVDVACNTSSSSTYRTGNLSYGGAAPTFSASCDVTTGVTVTPVSSTSNSFALSWSSATPSGSNTVEKYYYMINTTPPSSLSTMTSNTTTYLDNGLSTSVSTGSLVGSIKGSNTVYVVAVDDADNYSSSNCIKGIYTLDSDLPDPPRSVSVSDASIKESELWRASLAWSAPSYKGTGSITYTIQRSTNNSSWTTVATTTGTAYVDTVDESILYYWRIGAYDTSAESTASPTWASAVSLTPRGTYSEAPSLSSGPTVTEITTRQAKISWSTSRDADSKIQYGKKKGDYYDEEPSKSEQVTDHEILLTNLNPGTTYFYKARWTDEDGNVGVSAEKSFKTDPPPQITEPRATLVGIESATIAFTAKDAHSVKIYYGKNTSFGSITELKTTTSSNSYSVLLGGLSDDTKYYFKINAFDSENEEYDGNTLSFQTLPSPKISNVKIQQALNTAQPTAVITWVSNTEISSIVTYTPQGNPSASRDEVDLALKKGEHQTILRGLLPETRYDLKVSGRDVAGNEAVGEVNYFTTATDTRAPLISDIKIEGASKKDGSAVSSQLIVTWNTDEASTTQVEFGEGTGTVYSQKSQEDANLTFNHLAALSGLTPSKVYHLRVISKDKAGNVTNSIDVVTITPKATDNALDLVVNNLKEVFGFISN